VKIYWQQMIAIMAIVVVVVVEDNKCWCFIIGGQWWLAIATTITDNSCWSANNIF
jgi:hypothetical protein